MTSTALYSINVPARSNAGRSVARSKARFLSTVARVAGGYTLHPANASGAWRDPATGKTFLEHMGAVDFIGHRASVLRAWHKAFPDQIAAMVTGPIPAHIVTMKG